MRLYAPRVLASCLPWLLLPASALAQSHTTPLLIPMPHQVSPRGDDPLPHGVQILCTGCDSEDSFTAQDLRQTLEARHIAAASDTGLRIELGRGPAEAAAPPEARAESYSITYAPGTLKLTASTATGLFYAAQTAKQMISTDAQGRAVLHAAEIHDWPSLRYRGLSDDLSRGPVDTLAYQERLIRLLAAYKANVYSPYFEHTQQYAADPLPAPPGGAMSAEDARTLVAYARQFHITVIPDQEAFGHLHHNLNSEVYSQLAETPHGTVLAPAQPGSLELIGRMFTELSALYPGPFLHIGADETVDLGQGQTRPAVAAHGLAPVYLDYLQKIDGRLRPLHRRLLFWGDIAQDSPDLLKGLPADFKRNTVAVAWWYNPRPQGFARYIKPFTDAGIETWVAPGINNWSRVYPNWNYAISNIQQFTRDGKQMGATGQLNTIWYDDGEALASNNDFGILFGAAQAWQGGEGSPAQFEAAYGPVLHGDQTGKLNEAQREIMAAQELLKTEAKVGDASDGLFWIDPWSKDGQGYAAKIRPYTHELRLHAERALTLIAEVRAAYPCSTLYVQMGPRRQVQTNCSRQQDEGPGAPSIAPAMGGIGTVPNRPGAPSIAPAMGGTSPEPRTSTEDTPLQDNPASPSFAPTSLREPDAIDALELGARRIDFIGLKFQLCDEIPAIYAKAQAEAASSDRKAHVQLIYDLSSIRGVNGRLEDIVDGYSLLRDLYAQLWLRTNRPYALRPVLEHYDYTVGLWYSRIDRLRSAQRQWDDAKTLPSAAELGLPPAPPSR